MAKRHVTRRTDKFVAVLAGVTSAGRWQALFWALALVTGTVAAGFRLGITWLQAAVYGAPEAWRLGVFVDQLPWLWIVITPAVGGLTVGLILHRFTPDGRVRAVADVIEGAALREGRVERRAGLASAVASLITLSTGGSSGREGPVVHLAGVVSTFVANRINANGVTGRELLGCAVAAAVSASFNAPIAGAIFALEVVLRHYAVHAFAPIAIASVAGTVVGRLIFGNGTEFAVPQMGGLAFYVELPAFLLLGIVCGLVAVVLMRSVFLTEAVMGRVQERLKIHRALRPAIAGLMLGVIAVFFPHIIGVGYETTTAALTGQITLSHAIVFAMVKTAAVAITLGGRMGGGIFSPALMLGALTGLAFGLIATDLFPDVSGAGTLYALAGMGAVAAAVLGAPISTTLIVFELTGDWQTGIAVMTAVSISTAIASRLVEKSFFLSQIELRNLHLAAGPQAYLLSTFSVAQLMRPLDAPRAAKPEECWDLIADGIHINGTASLDQAMPLFERSGAAFIPVVTLGGEADPPELWGALFHVDALKAFNKALAAAAAEEHA